jgi:hypothetical protein
MGKQFRSSVLVVVAALFAGVVLSGCGIATGKTADQYPPSISVTGNGEASGPPDIAFIDLGADFSGGDLGEAVADANNVMTSLTSALGDLGIAPEDIQTTSYNVWQDQRYDSDGQPTGQIIYHVNTQLRVKVRDLTKVSDVIDVSLTEGVNQINGLSFGIDDTVALESEARTDAVADARARAEELAAALGVTVGKPISVSEGFVGSPIPYPVERAAADAAGGFGGGAAPAISQGQLTITSQVYVTFELLP